MRFNWRAVGRAGFVMVLLAVMPSAAAAVETADLTFDSASFRDAYLEIAGVWGLDIIFDPKVRGNQPITLEMEAVTAFEALERLSRAGNHAIVVGEGGELIVMDDTPQNRREYEPLEMATLTPKFIPAKDLDKLLRSLIEARRIAVDEHLQTVTMRDTRSKICIARKLLDALDQAPAEIELHVQVLQLEGAGVSTVPHIVAEDGILDVFSRSGSTVLASFGMSLVGSSRGEMEFPAPGELPGTFEFSVSGQNHFGTNDVTLAYRFEWSRKFAVGDAQRSERYHSARETVRLSRGQTVVQPISFDSPGSSMVLAIEPKIIRASALDPDSLATIKVGTESHLSCRGDHPLEEVLAGVEVQRGPQPVVHTDPCPIPAFRSGPGPGPAGYSGRPGPPVGVDVSGEERTPDEESPGTDGRP